MNTKTVAENQLKAQTAAVESKRNRPDWSSRYFPVLSQIKKIPTFIWAFLMGVAFGVLLLKSRTFLLIAMLVFFLGSPFWTSLLIVLTPQGSVALPISLCVVQAVLAYAVWWFFWGGGIGGEAHLAESWQWAFGLALLPVVVAFLKIRHGNHKAGR